MALDTCLEKGVKYFNISNNFELSDMDKPTAIKVFESLSSGIRLDIYRLLVRYGREGLVAGQIGAQLDIPPTNLSFHLKAMTNASLLSAEQEGRFQRYRANIPLMLQLIAYLTEECCSANTGRCASQKATSPCSKKVLPPIVNKTKRKKS